MQHFYLSTVMSSSKEHNDNDNNTLCLPYMYKYKQSESSLLTWVVLSSAQMISRLKL